MAKPWDDSLKKLVHTDPQAFVTWLFPDGTFIGQAKGLDAAWNHFPFPTLDLSYSRHVR